MTLRTALLALGILWGATANAQVPTNGAAKFPDHPIKLVVPFPPAGPTDIMARVYAEKLGVELGQPIIVENRVGADFVIGAQQVARAAPDGYTLLIAMDVTMVMNPLTNGDLPFKPQEDFTPVSLTAFNTSLLLVPASGPKTARELIARAKSNPGRLNYGAGIITTRLAGYMFARLAGIDAVFVPYKGSAEVVQALLDGSIQFAVDGVAAHFPLIQGGQLRALAKLNNRRLASLPELKPLSEEADMPGLGEISTWAGIVGPRGMAPEIIAKIRDAIVKASNDPALVETLDKLGIVATSSTPAEFASFVKDETARWFNVIRDSGVNFK